jgi:adenylate cyclase
MSEEIQREQFRKVLTGEHPDLTKMRFRFKHLPSDPRCKLCWAPFSGVGGALVRHFGFGRFPGNPAICQNCISQFRKSGVSAAEIPSHALIRRHSRLDQHRGTTDRDRVQ